MSNAAAGALDDAFRVLTDGTRRAVLGRLADGPASVSELAAPFAMALPSFLQHLEMLSETGFVRSRKEGRTRFVELAPTAPQALRRAEHWLMRQRRLWELRLGQLDAYLVTLKAKQEHAATKAQERSTKRRRRR